MFETLLVKAIRCFLSYFSTSMTRFPSTYHSELFDDPDEDSALFSTGGEETAPNVPIAAVLYQVQTLLHSPL